MTRQLNRSGIRAAAIHGNKTQANRKRTLDSFRSGKTAILVATDIAARGIDVDDVSHVFNFDLPNESETYVHRIGRTARAGASGTAIAFCAPDERSYLKAIERLMRQPLNEPEHDLELSPLVEPTAPDRKSKTRGSNNRSRPSRGKPKSRAGGERRSQSSHASGRPRNQKRRSGGAVVGRRDVMRLDMKWCGVKCSRFRSIET